ncbi:MAG TPA: hypothetical protein PLH57_02805 [Oligoflexia bacterium]|nr:hypothetical protein [Oligoflexia bacterium]
MLISAFTIVRNGVRFDYPFLESIRSVLPICEELIINVGDSDDSTEQALHQMIAGLSEIDQKKIQIFNTHWPLNDPEKRKGGQILAEQTNYALSKCSGQWCLYLQADEVLQEDDLSIISQAAEAHLNDDRVDAFVFEYVHFYADYTTIQTSRSSYRREIRMVRRSSGAVSVGDAQSFRLPDGTKPRAVLLKAKIYHYGWVKNQDVMRLKTGFMDTLYHQNADAALPATGPNYLFKSFVGLKKFTGRHPGVMKTRVEAAGNFDFSRAPRVFQIKDVWKIVSGWIERATGWRPFEYKSYRLIR